MKPFKLTRIARYLWGLLGVAILGGGAAVASAGGWEDGQKYVPSASIELGTNREIVFVYMGASFCGASRREGFGDVIEKSKLLVSQQARNQGRTFRAVGVALDWEVEEGLRFLKKFGAFDEVSLGGNWGNDSAIKYIWRDHPGRAAVPQVIVLEREIEEAPRTTEITREVVLRRINGITEIESWVANGARVPLPAPARS